MTRYEGTAPADRREEDVMDQAEKQNQVILKVILLELIAAFPDLTYDELMQLALGTMYMDYFTFCTIYPTLEASDLVRERARKQERRVDSEGQPLKRLELTDRGRGVRETMAPLLPEPVAAFLAEAKRPQQESLRRSRDVEADYRPSPARGYDVMLAIKEEGHVIFSLTVEVPSEAAAKAMIHRFRRTSGEFYLKILTWLHATPADEAAPVESDAPDATD